MFTTTATTRVTRPEKGMSMSSSTDVRKAGGTRRTTRLNRARQPIDNISKPKETVSDERVK
ncbi:hypothetical protein PHLCEN_2v3690 [Hermanssonia centrifuga]|uniref:Uncharacterized protein n=1 Tax=Hermanssonia centrifuga TaxID=98765 RepID=A0A2R6QEF6_9APHY|nr:hypothetical protein PHLCEN_2v3690 [Hermanssonia centrifuga]